MKKKNQTKYSYKLLLLSNKIQQFDNMFIIFLGNICKKKKKIVVAV